MEYKFTTSAKRCSLCDKTYKELEYFYSVLKIDEKPKETQTDEKIPKQKKKEELALELKRSDICEGCWENISTENYFSWWRMQKAVKPKIPALKDADFLWQLFTQAQAILYQAKTFDEAEEIIQEAEQKTEETKIEAIDLTENISQQVQEAEQFAYVASLGLLRLKQIKLKSYKNFEGYEYLVFTFPNSKNDVEIKDPKLNAAGLEKLEQKIEKLSEDKFNSENEQTAED